MGSKFGERRFEQPQPADCRCHAHMDCAVETVRHLAERGGACVLRRGMSKYVTRATTPVRETALR